MVLEMAESMKGWAAACTARWSRGEIVWAEGQNSQPQPGRGKLIKRKPFPAANAALSKWKEITAPRAVNRSPEHMPIGV